MDTRPPVQAAEGRSPEEWKQTEGMYSPVLYVTHKV